MKKAKKIKLIAFDVDGTLTDGSLMIGPEGEVCKFFHARDGLSFSLAHRMGYAVGFITGRRSAAVEARGKELQMDFVLMGISHKTEAMEKLLGEYGFSREEAAYMGDDLNDLSLMEMVGFSGCPVDGAEEVRRAADFVSRFSGGRGAAREFIEIILKSQNRWKEAVRSYQLPEEKVIQ